MIQVSYYISDLFISFNLKKRIGVAAPEVLKLLKIFGPLRNKSKNIRFMVKVIGIASFIKFCLHRVFLLFADKSGEIDYDWY